MNLNDKSGIELTYAELIHVATALSLVLDLPQALFELYSRGCNNRTPRERVAIHQDTSTFALALKQSGEFRAALKRSLEITREIGNARALAQQRWGMRERLLSSDLSDLPEDSMERLIGEGIVKSLVSGFPYDREGRIVKEGGQHD